MAAYVELAIEQGANLTSFVNVTDTQGDAVDLTTYSASSMLRKSYYSSSQTAISAIVTGNANGEVTLSLSADTTANLTPGRYVYDLIVTDSATNSIQRVIEGTAVILPSVTR